MESLTSKNMLRSKTYREPVSNRSNMIPSLSSKPGSRVPYSLESIYRFKAEASNKTADEMRACNSL